MFLLFVSFLAGVLSVFAACVLPLLPVIVGGSLTTGGSRRRMYTIIFSLAVSIVAFTLLLKASTVLIGVPEHFWRYISGGVLVLLGVFLLFPNLWVKIPGINALNRSSNRLLAEGYQRGGFWGDVLMGVALGPVFASCSPTYFIILATVLPAQPILGFVYLVSYALGLSLALLAIVILGEKLIQRLGVTLDPSGWFFRGIGALIIVVGVLVGSGLMLKVETWLVERGFDATFVELKLLGSGKEEMPKNPKDISFLPPSAKPAMYTKAPEIVSPGGYVNTGGEPITIGEFVGKKVVLVDFWTYSCINCQRTFPYLRAWHDTYADEGLVIIGVHTPEFAFEQVLENVAKAADTFDLKHPIVLDNDYATWRAFENHYWPRKYLIDIDGYIVYDHIGEGAYEETEEAIRRALEERTERLNLQATLMPASSPEDVITVAPGGVRSPEVYFGLSRNEWLGNSGDSQGVFTLPSVFKLNTLYLEGSWTGDPEYLKSLTKGSIVFRYDAKNVYFVASAGVPITVTVFRDGEILTTERGGDVDENGQVLISEDRLYHIIEGAEYGEHVLELRIEAPGLEAYTFTFG